MTIMFEVDEHVAKQFNRVSVLNCTTPEELLSSFMHDVVTVADPAHKAAAAYVDVCTAEDRSFPAYMVRMGYLPDEWEEYYDDYAEYMGDRADPYTVAKKDMETYLEVMEYINGTAAHDD